MTVRRPPVFNPGEINVYPKPRDVADVTRALRHTGRRVMLVPTMGALHDGHLSLVRAAKRVPGSVVVVSIFVNPLQFGAGEDLDAYPRTLDSDVALLRGEGVEIVFTPTAADMYPNGLRTTVQPGPLAAELEGGPRPTHFTGVLTVVLKLLQIVRPDRVFFGEKDYQQLVMIRQMVADLNLDVAVIGVPTMRESDGLAMSSRNRYLDPTQRELAGTLAAALTAGAHAAPAGTQAALDAAACGARRRARTGGRLPGVAQCRPRSGARQRIWPAAGSRQAGHHQTAGQHRSRDRNWDDQRKCHEFSRFRRHPWAGRTRGHPYITWEELMLRTMLKSKIHRATVTQADLHYVGSVTIDADLMEAADLLEGEQVTIVDIDNGARLVTYAITGERGTGVIGINGAAAHLVHPGDLVILIAYGTMEDAEARAYQPRIVFVDAMNKQIDLGHDPAFVPADVSVAADSDPRIGVR